MVNTILAPDPQALKEKARAEAVIHHKAAGFSDRFALGFTKLLRFAADTFFAKRYGHRAIVLETVAAAPGMVGATINHLTALRRMRDDGGWIRTLMEEAENERMHLMTFVQIARVVGYFEEEAVISDTLYLKEIEEGRSPNVPAPAIARHYWKLPDTATLRDVILVVRADEAHHRDVNHGFASSLAGLPVDRPAAPCPPHAGEIRLSPQ